MFEYVNVHTSYINVVTECENIEGLAFDDDISVTSWNKLTADGQNMCCVRNNVTSGYHSVTHTNKGARFFVYVYGISEGHGSSYAYTATGIPEQGRYISMVRVYS